MISDSVAMRIATLASDFVMRDAENPQWGELGVSAAKLRDLLIEEKQVAAAELTGVMADLCRFMAEDEAADSRAVVPLLDKLLGQMQMIGEQGHIDQSRLKEAVAQANLFLRDQQEAPRENNPALQESAGVEEEFLLEIETRINDLEHRLFSMKPGERDPETVRAVFREFHTLKGEAGIIGLKSLSSFYHVVESAIEGARHGGLVLTDDVIGALQELTHISRHLLRGEDVPSTAPSNIAAVQKRLEQASLAASVDAAQEPQEEPGPEDLAAAAMDAEAFFAEAEDDEVEGASGEEAADAPEMMSEPLPPPLPQPPTPIQAGVALSAPSPAVVAGTAGGSAKSSSVMTRAVTDAQIEGESPDAVQVERLNSITMDVRRLDQLMELVGEVALLGNQLAQNPDLLKIAALSIQVQDFNRSCRSLQELSAGLRMTPVQPLFHRVQRAAFESARQVHKRVDVKISGGDTEVDRVVIDRLTAAMVHLVRNAVDHGLEQPADRLAAGKPERGLVQLKAYRTDSDVVIEMSDDGRGIDTEAIRKRVAERGLLPNPETASEKELIDMIFSPGFSTARSVTGISGRGVGMGVVKESIDSLRGRLEVQNHFGQGAQFTLRFPVALAAIEGLLVRLGGSMLILPVMSVRETFCVEPGHVHTVEERGTVVTIRGVVVPVLRMSEYLDISGDSERVEDGVLVILEEEDRLVAVLVDEVLDTRQVIVRQMTGELQSLEAVTGAALLSDRRVALVLDARRMLDRVHVMAGREFREASDRQVMAGANVETVDIGSNAVGMIDFVVRGDRGGKNKDYVYAINAFKAREFVPVSELTKMPSMPRGFAGMLLLREHTVPVVALSVLLGLVDDDKRHADWEKIIVICEFAGQTVGFLVTHVNRVSYISWNEILPPPDTGGMIAMEYIVGTVLMKSLREDSRGGQVIQAGSRPDECDQADVAFVLDFERIVQQVLHLYDEFGPGLDSVQQRKTENTILLVEDSPLIRRQTAAALTQAGINVLLAENGKAALDMVRGLMQKATEENGSIFNYLDLVLSDIEMPTMDGYTLTTHIKRDPDLRLLPVLLHSSITNDTMVNRGKDVGADGFVPKCDPQELVAQLRRYL